MVAAKIAKSFKNVSSIQLKERGKSGERFIRIKAVIDARQPLRRVVKLRREDASEMMAYQHFATDTVEWATWQIIAIKRQMVMTIVMVLG